MCVWLSFVKWETAGYKKGEGSWTPRTPGPFPGVVPWELRIWLLTLLKSSLPRERVASDRVSMSENSYSASPFLLLSVVSMLPPKELWNLSQALYPLYHSGHQDLIPPECPQPPQHPCLFLQAWSIPFLLQPEWASPNANLLVNQLWLKFLPAPPSLQESE